MNLEGWKPLYTEVFILRGNKSYFGLYCLSTGGLATLEPRNPEVRPSILPRTPTRVLYSTNPSCEHGVGIPLSAAV